MYQVPLFRIEHRGQVWTGHYSIVGTGRRRSSRSTAHTALKAPQRAAEDPSFSPKSSSPQSSTIGALEAADRLIDRLTGAVERQLTDPTLSHEDAWLELVAEIDTAPEIDEVKRVLAH